MSCKEWSCGWESGKPHGHLAPAIFFHSNYFSIYYNYHKMPDSI